MARSIGIVECDCLSDVLSAADRMVKTADVHLMRRIQLGHSQLALVLEGDSVEVERALATVRTDIAPQLTITLIANIHPQVLRVFGLPGGLFSTGFVTKSERI